MAALDDVSANNDILAGLRHIVADALWGWILGHEDDDVFTVRLSVFRIPIRKTFRVRDLEPFAVLLFGPKPVGDALAPLELPGGPA